MHMNNQEYDPKLVEQFFREYHDRGMMKWQGFYLSDHTVALAKSEKKILEKNSRKRPPAMSDIEISKIINMAIKKNRDVVIELKELNENMILPEAIQGKILGYQNDKLMVDNQYVDIRNIHSVQYLHR